MSGYEQILRRAHLSHSDIQLGFRVCTESLCADLRTIIQSQVRYGLKSGDQWLIDSHCRRAAFETLGDAVAHRDMNYSRGVRVVEYHLAPDGGVV